MVDINKKPEEKLQVFEIIQNNRRKPPIKAYLPKIKKENHNQNGFYIAQGNANNKLTKAKTNNIKSGVVTRLGDLKISHEDLVVTIKKQSDSKISTLGTTAKRLLDYCDMTATTGGFKNSLISFRLDEYMDSCGLKDKKSAIEQLKKDFAAIGPGTKERELTCKISRVK